MFLAMFSKCTTSENNAWRVTDQDTVNLYDSFRGIEYDGVSGSIFKAIDPRYIANRHGVFTVLNDFGESSNKTFTLLIEGNERDIVPSGINYEIPPVVGRLWNYYINGKLMFWYQRIIPFKLMPHAIEKVEYLTAEQCKDTIGMVHITTRNIECDIFSDKSTLYLLDDIVITGKIFEAINPVHIQSLQRITDKDKISAYGRKEIKEVVNIKTFKRKDINYLAIVFGDSHWSYDVNGIQFNGDTYSALNSSFFKTFKNVPATQEKYPEKTRIIIVTL
jgi:hypothetical protein